MVENLLDRVEINPKKMAGKPVIKGTRITVDAIIERLAYGLSEKEILKDYPNLTEKDIKSALFFATKILRNEEITPMSQHA